MGIPHLAAASPPPAPQRHVRPDWLQGALGLVPAHHSQPCAEPAARIRAGRPNQPHLVRGRGRHHAPRWARGGMRCSALAGGGGEGGTALHACACRLHSLLPQRSPQLTPRFQRCCRADADSDDLSVVAVVGIVIAVNGAEMSCRQRWPRCAAGLPAEHADFSPAHPPSTPMPCVQW